MVKKIYLDNASSTQIDLEILEDIYKNIKFHYGNPSSLHSHGRESKVIIEKSRRKIANLLGTTPDKIIFTSGGTESNNWIIQKAIESLNIKHIITSKIEHLSVLLPIEYISKQKNIKVSFVRLDDKNHIDYNHLEHILKNNNEKVLISLMHANNELGNISDIYLISNLAKKYAAYFHSDTVQTIGHLDLNLKNLNLDFCVGSAHKFHGPKGIGFIYIAENCKISPFFFGGGQEINMRPGTENLFGILGMSLALEKSLKNLEKDKDKILNLKKILISEIKDKIPTIKFNGDSLNIEKSLYNLLNIQIPYEGEEDLLLLELDMNGISISLGSACSSGTNKKSHVLDFIKNDDKNIVDLRISLSKYNKKEDILYLVKVINKLIIKSKEKINF